MNAFTKELNCGEAVDLAELRLGGVQEDLAKEIKKFGETSDCCADRGTSTCSVLDERKCRRAPLCMVSR